MFIVYKTSESGDWKAFRFDNPPSPGAISESVYLQEGMYLNWYGSTAPTKDEAIQEAEDAGFQYAESGKPISSEFLCTDFMKITPVNYSPSEHSEVDPSSREVNFSWISWATGEK